MLLLSHGALKGFVNDVVVELFNLMNVRLDLGRHHYAKAYVRGLGAT